MSGLGKTSIGADAEFKHIESSNLGDHDHTRQSLLIEHRIYPIDQISLGIGSSLVHYSRWGWEYWPGADINIDLTDNLTWYATFEKSFRVPTYTELYYFTAANQGNPSLKPEKAWTGETGLKWLSQGISSSLSLFYRDLEDAVTWLRQPEQTAWQAKNIATIQTKGGEVSFTIYPGFFLETELFSSACFAYTYLESNRSIPGTMESKYVLDYLRHQLTGSLTITWFPALEQVIKTRYGERIVGDNYTVVDSRLTYSFSDFQIFCQANNLFNEDYIESGFAPMPDCWITVGIKFNWD
jgi:iron complex outermembrane receptor protein